MQLSRARALMVAAAIVLVVSPPRMGGDDSVSPAAGAEGVSDEGGDSSVYWPSEQEQRLDELDKQLLDTMQKLFTAKYHDETAAVEKLTREYEAQQKERLELLRATGQLPPR